ncbi:amino acid transporter [Alteribacter lacisalsi]|uniref:Amino acid transporter n=1 Tax=Alteribacter lacisalsi TaxID=2045244 RepID=A0A2W0H6F4_9BACI|nr:LysE family transporter [Alteribacter lacisalsi]PYZ95690.1 amino acid transporter [Alteribacter lacisalsi]
MTQSWFYFLFLGITLAAPVGPLSMEMVRRGLVLGFWGALLTGLGGLFADLLFMVMIYSGAGFLLSPVPVQAVLYVCGSFFLCFLGWQSLFLTGNFSIEPVREIVLQYRSGFFSGIGIAGLNPLNILFWFGIYGSVLAGLKQTETSEVVITASIMIVAGILLWNIFVSAFIHFLKDYVHARMVVFINRLAGVMLILFAGTFLYKGFYLMC